MIHLQGDLSLKYISVQCWNVLIFISTSVSKLKIFRGTAVQTFNRLPAVQGMDDGVRFEFHRRKWLESDDFVDYICCCCEDGPFCSSVSFGYCGSLYQFLFRMTTQCALSFVFELKNRMTRISGHPWNLVTLRFLYFESLYVGEIKIGRTRPTDGETDRGLIYLACQQLKDCVRFILDAIFPVLKFLKRVQL